MKTTQRCHWAESHELLLKYHDREWGKPSHDDGHLFEMLNLEGAQAGLSWLTILKKRDAYRKAFDGFNPKKMAKYDSKKVAALLKDDGIVRNRLKVRAFIGNARAYLDVCEEFGNFDRYLWSFVGGNPLKGGKPRASSPESDALSKDLKKRGFRFVGTTICYAFMQAVGMVNDHSPGCFRNPP